MSSLPLTRESYRLFDEFGIGERCGASSMGAPAQYWLIVVAGTLGSLCCLCWKTSITLSSPSVLAKASIQVDLSLPSSSSSSSSSLSSIVSQHVFSNISRKQHPVHRSKRRHQGPLSRFMIQLYNRRPDADIVRAVEPLRVSSSTSQSSRVLEFEIPKTRTSEEDLESAELLGFLGTILRVSSMDHRVLSDVGTSRLEDNWRAFDVTTAVKDRKGDNLRLLVKGRTSVTLSHRDKGPILVLSYAKPRSRRSRAIHEEDHEEGVTAPWVEEGGRRLRRRNLCRRRPLYVDFASIAYDEWIVAPPGYEAYQCVGKCFYPFGDHLSPTKHAIVQTLVHGAVQGTDVKGVGRACCVPTKLAPTSLLYIDATGTLTYQYRYEDMVVAECGCR